MRDAFANGNKRLVNGKSIDILQSHKSRVAEEFRNSAGGDCEATAMWSMGVAPKGKLKITNNLQPLQHIYKLLPSDSEIHVDFCK